jgi:hypothetical protein
MRIVLTWLRLEARQRWVSLVVLALLVAVATATVLTASAGARRGQSAFDRLWAQTLPATVTVLPNQPGFDWSRIRALPEVAALSEFAVVSNYELSCCQAAQTGFPAVDAVYGTALERPVMLQGRLYRADRADEIVATPQFMSVYHKHLGDSVTLLLATTQQANEGFDTSSGLPGGPRIRARIVGVARNVFGSSTEDGPGSSGGFQVSPALFAHYRANFIGTTGGSYINALIRLRGGHADIARFRADLARVTGRSDIDVWDNYDYFGGPVKRITGYEAASLLAFALAALVAAIFLIGQAVARYTSGCVADLQVLQAVGMTSRQAVASAAAAPFLAAVGGATLGVAAAIVASRWMPIGAAQYSEPHPGISADWPILGPGWLLAPVLVGAGSVAAAAVALRARRHQAVPHRSAIVAATAQAGLPVPLVVGARFALEPGRGRSSVPVRPALVGAIIGVLGVLAAFTFSAGVSDAAANPARFGQTWQLGAFLGFSGQDFSPAASQVLRTVARDRDVTGVDDALVGGAQAGQVSVESFTYAPVGSKKIAVVLTGGRMPAAADEIVLAPTTAKELHVSTGGTVKLAGGGPPQTMKVSGIGFVPTGPHNSYDTGAWLTPAGYQRIFRGSHYTFKFHLAVVSLRPGSNVAAAALRLTGEGAKVKGGQAFPFTPQQSALPQVQALRDVAVLPLALAAFLGLLAVAAVGYALSIAVRRRRHELAVLRALGLTRRQSRLVIFTQATLLAVVGLAFGVPLGVALGRTVWRAATGMVPLAYHTPAALWALALIAPVALVVANLLAGWPGRRAARLNTGQVLRTE